MTEYFKIPIKIKKKMKKLSFLISFAITLNFSLFSQIQMNSSGNLGLGTTPSETYKFYTNGESYFGGGDIYLNDEVGIGVTPDPNYKLKVSGSTYFSGGNIYLNDKVGIGVIPHPNYKLRVSGSTYFGGGSTYLSTYVGIGATPNTSYKLSVGGNTYINGYTGIGATPSSTYRLRVSGISQFQNVSITHDLILDQIQFDEDEMYLSQSKLYIYGYYGDTYVGIRTPPSTSYTLDVSGPTRCSAGYWQQSDKRFKKDIVNLDGKKMLDKINEVSAKKYKYKTREELLPLYSSGTLPTKTDTISVVEVINGKDSTIRKTRVSTPIFSTGDNFGFLAQDLKKVFPELVKLDSTDGTYAIHYNGLIPVMFEAIKEQQRLILEMETKIENLQSDFKNKSAEIKIISEDTPGYDSPTSSVKSTLYQNTPNPFTTNTVINYDLSENVQNAMLNIYNMNGTQLKSIQLHQQGNGSITINGGEYNAGMYMYALIADGQVIDTKQMILTD